MSEMPNDRYSNWGIEGRSALVTGGSSGIGKATVEALQSLGANVSFTYNKGVEAAEKLQATAPDQLAIHQLDLGCPESIKRTVEEARHRWGRLDIFVHSAGVGTATVEKYEPNTEKQIEAFYMLNAVAPHLLLQAVLEAMEQNGDDKRRDIVTISSVGFLQQVFHNFNSADGSSKAAMALATKHLAAQKAHDPRYRINSIAPGATATPMLEASVYGGMTNEQLQAFEQQLPNQRMITPEEIADTVVFLCSKYANAIRGAVIDASAGLAVRPGLITEM